jgi:RNA recognition motif-containing protein
LYVGNLPDYVEETEFVNYFYEVFKFCGCL